MENKFPDTWKLMPLEECMEAIIDYGGKTPHKSSFGIPLITAKIVKGGRILEPTEFIPFEDYDERMQRGIPNAGDIVVTTEAPLGEVGQLDNRKLSVGQRLITLRGKHNLLDNTYLKFLMMSELVQNQLLARATGTTVVGIKQTELRKIELIIPPFPEQRTIAGILGTLDDKIEINRRVSATLESIARTVFRQWFVVNEEALGWDISPLSKLCESIFSGGTPSTTKPEYWNGGIPWLSSGETRERFVIDTDKTITQTGVDNSSTRFARNGSTVIASAGQGKTRGQTSLLLFDTYINQSVVVLNANKGLISDLFLFFDLSRRYEEFRQISDSHSSRGSLTTKLLGDLQIAVPPMELIEKFNQFAEPIVEQIHQNLKQSRTLGSLRDSLLPKLMRGEVRVKDVEKDL